MYSTLFSKTFPSYLRELECATNMPSFILRSEFQSCTTPLTNLTIFASLILPFVVFTTRIWLRNQNVWTSKLVKCVSSSGAVK